MKGQITVFIIAGIVLLMALGMFLAIRPVRMQQIDVTSAHADTLYLKECLEQNIRFDVGIMYEQGGFFLEPDYFVDKNLTVRSDTYIPYYTKNVPDLNEEFGYVAEESCDICGCSGIKDIIVSDDRILFKFDDAIISLDDNIVQLVSIAKNISDEFCLTCYNLSFEDYEGKARIFNLDGLRFAR